MLLLGQMKMLGCVALSLFLKHTSRAHTHQGGHIQRCGLSLLTYQLLLAPPPETGRGRMHHRTEQSLPHLAFAPAVPSCFSLAYCIEGKQLRRREAFVLARILYLIYPTDKDELFVLFCISLKELSESRGWHLFVLNSKMKKEKRKKTAHHSFHFQVLVMQCSWTELELVFCKL